MTTLTSSKARFGENDKVICYRVCNCCIATYQTVLINQVKDYYRVFIDEFNEQQLKQSDSKKKNYIRPSAPSDCSSLREQAIAELDVDSGGDDSSRGSLGGGGCDDGGSSV